MIFRTTVAAAAGFSAPMYSAIASRSRSARLVQRRRKPPLPLRLQALVAHEGPLPRAPPPTDRGDLPLVQLEILLDRFGRQEGAASLGCLRQLVQAGLGAPLKSERQGFAHGCFLCTMCTLSAAAR